MGNDMKNNLYLWFSYFTIYSLLLYFNKNDSPVLTHLLAIETVSKFFGFVSWRKINITVFYTCFCPQLIRNVRSRRRIDSSSIITHPVNFDRQRERPLKCDAKNSTHTYTDIYVYHPIDYRYGISLSIGNNKKSRSYINLSWVTYWNMLTFPLFLPQADVTRMCTSNR